LSIVENRLLKGEVGIRKWECGSRKKGKPEFGIRNAEGGKKGRWKWEVGMRKWEGGSGNYSNAEVGVVMSRPSVLEERFTIRALCLRGKQD
jgi:hypothetical protein